MIDGKTRPTAAERPANRHRGFDSPGAAWRGAHRLRLPAQPVGTGLLRRRPLRLDRRRASQTGPRGPVYICLDVDLQERALEASVTFPDIARFQPPRAPAPAEDAVREADSRDLDLVEVAPKADPPVCRIMDYGKYRYEQKRRARESRKHQHTVTVKEIKYRPKIDTHDFDYKTKHVRQFLGEGNKVKVTVMFRGREMAHPEFGRDILKKVVEETQDLCSSEFGPADFRMEGRNMSLVLQPTK